MWKALVFAALLLVLADQARAQAQFLPLLFSGQPKLTAEQAAQVSGVWNLTSGFHVDGSVLDSELQQANSSDSVDFAGVLANATSPSKALAIKLFIPAIDPNTGVFWAYSLMHPAGRKPGVQRTLGMGAATADGVLLSGTKDEDTGLWYGLVENATTMVALYMEGLEAWDGNHTKVLDNQVIAQYVYTKLPDDEVQAAFQVVAASKLEAGSMSQEIAATDRATHSHTA